MNRSQIEINVTNESLIVPGEIPVRVAEVFVAAKSSERLSEDIVVITEDFIAVLDGMSSPLRATDDEASGRAFALRAAGAIAKLPRSVAAREAVNLISSELRPMVAAHRGPSGAVGAMYSVERSEVWRVGDVHVAVGSVHHPAEKEIDTVFAGLRAALDVAAINRGIPEAVVRSEDPGALAAGILLEAQPAFANRIGPFGYGVFDGSRIPDDHIEIFPVRPCEAVVLATDGFLTAAPELSLAQADLAAVFLRDPLCLGELRGMGKALGAGADAPDDRSYVRIEPQGEPR